MKTAGIIAEYNPFHNGHKYLIDRARQEGADRIVAVMSGNFVQRGEPAILSSAIRTEAALEGGADLVLQLPLPYATAGASDFARGGVEILDSTGIVDTLVFGAECADTAKLSALSSLLVSGETDSEIKAQLQSGITYAAARENAVRKTAPELADLMREPNNILGIEYINAVNRSGSSLVPFAVERKGAGHDSENITDGFASAGEIRRRIRAGEEWESLVPSPGIYGENPFVTDKGMAEFETMVLYKMRTVTAEEIALAPDISEGIENRIASAAAEAGSLEELYALAKTKRYTHARIRRIVLATLLGIRAEDVKKPVPYIRVMGFGNNGAQMLKEMKETASLPVVTKSADISSLGPDAADLFALECRAGDVYDLLKSGGSPRTREKDYKIIIKK